MTPPLALLSSVAGQPTAVETLRRALRCNRVPHAYLFEGQDGVGKERAAFGLAQALVCERRAAGSSDACGLCSACSRAVPRATDSLPRHPDVLVLARGLYEPAAIGRTSPETRDISIDQVRTLVLGRAAFAPHEGFAKVFIVRAAEELNASASNALLKTLEEPGARTHFILLTSAPDALLPTILSRVQRVRFGPLPDLAIARLLEERGASPGDARALAPLSGGSMANASLLADPQASQQRREFASRAREALVEASPDAAYAFAEDAKKLEKDALIALLHSFAADLAAEGRAAAAEAGRAAEVAARRFALALAAVQDIESNASVQLACEAMFLRMRST